MSDTRFILTTLSFIQYLLTDEKRSSSLLNAHEQIYNMRTL